MADGSAMKTMNSAERHLFSVEEAVARLEAGEWRDGDEVDVSDRLVLRADGPLGEKGLLQRLKGHMRLQAIASGVAEAGPAAASTPKVRADVKALLDAVRKAR